MEIHYGANGVRFAALDDYQTRREATRNDGGICLPLLVGLGGSFAALLNISTSMPDDSLRSILEISCLFTVVTSIFGALVAFRIVAEEEELLPSKGNKTAAAKHITGLGAALALGLVLFIISAAVLGQLLYPRFEIPEGFGLGMMLFLGGGFLFLTLTPRIGDLFGTGEVMTKLRFLTAWLQPVGRVLSIADSWLVHMVAPAVGATLLSWPGRYGCLMANVAIGTLFSWFSPAPLGFLGAIWAMLSVVSVARRWAWTEIERQRLHEQPSLPRSQLKVSIDQDLRDEAIWGLLMLMVVLPIAMRQFYLSAMEADAFQFDGRVQNDPIAWMGFFGIELVKALPFVDWADIYGASGKARIHVNSAIAMHAVFTARVVIDVLFLGTILQAISISVGLSRHKRDFLDGIVDALDERIERSEFIKLARLRKGVWSYRAEIAKFKGYNQKRLVRLKLTTKHHPRLTAAVARVCELANLKIEPPAEQLMGIANDRNPKRAALESAFQLVIDEKDFNLDHLQATRRFLNWKRSLEDVRQGVAQLLITKVTPTRDRDLALMEMIQGEDSDSLLAIRVMAVGALVRNARQNPEVVPILQTVAFKDRADAVRKRASAGLVSLGIQPVPPSPMSSATKTAS
ncbi:MAG: hypothetical protein ABL956_06860 [Hyphomonadaceae bacterium]